ncbi:MAG: hypothetical protein Kow00106_11550 [Anaerolineae bacterium]
MSTVLFYYLLLLFGLITMLLDGWGWVAWGTYLIAMPAGALAVRYGVLRSRPTLARPPWYGALRRAALMAALAATFVLALFAMLTAMGWVTVDRHSVSIRSLLVSVLGPQLLVATWEELTFRGALQPIVIARLGKVQGLAIASVLFGLFHLPNMFYHDVPVALIPQTVIALTMMGAVFGVATLRENGHLAVPIALHFGWNSACFGVEEIFVYHFTGPQWLVGTPAWFPESGLLGLLTLVILAVALQRLQPSSSLTPSDRERP